jgi:hypothetical protein
MAKFLKNLKSKVQHYKTKAEEIQAMIQDGAETIRDIRADVEDTVDDLKTDSEEKMMESLEQIQEAERVFKEAGYLLHAVELEMGFNPKVVAILRRESEVSSRIQERLLKQHENNKVISTMLKALFKAEALEDKVHLRRLTFHEVHIELGLVPAVHVLWEDRSAAVTPAAIGSPISSSSSSYESPFSSSSSPFSSSSSPFSSSSSPFSSSSTEKEEPVPQPEPEAEAPVEETQPKPAVIEEEPTTPEVSVSAQDPEEDKWTSFPDISFPSSK